MTKDEFDKQAERLKRYGHRFDAFHYLKLSPGLLCYAPDESIIEGECQDVTPKRLNLIESS